MAFTIDFETGNGSQLTGNTGLQINFGDPLDVDGYSARASLIDERGWITFDPTLETIIRFRIWFHPDINFPSDYDAAYFIELSETDDIYSNNWSLYLRRFDNSVPNVFGVLKSDFSQLEQSGTGFVLDEILECEIDYKSGDGDGHFIFKVNDVEVFNIGSLSNVGETVSCFHIGLLGGTQPSKFPYFDDITDDIGGGEIIVDLGLVTETNTALSLSKVKTKEVGLISESDSALQLSVTKIKEVGIITETDSVFSLSHSKIKDVGIVSETSTALDIDSTKAKDISLNVETDSALPVSIGKIIEIGIASEINTPQSLASVKVKDTGIVTETDAAQNIDKEKSFQIGIISETNTALNLLSQKLKELGIISESDSALAVTLATDLYNISLSAGIFTSENIFEFDVDITSLSFNLGSYQVAIGFNQSIINGGILSMELVAGSSNLVSNSPDAFCGVIDVDGVYELGFASFPGDESITGPTRVGRFRVTNTNQFLMIQPELTFNFSGAGTTYIQDTSFNNVTDQDLFDSTLEFVLFNSLGIVSENDTALPISREKIKETSLISEVDLALPVSFSRTIEIGIAEEISFAHQLSGVLKEAQIGVSSETDFSLPFVGDIIIDIGMASEINSALKVKRRLPGKYNASVRSSKYSVSVQAGSLNSAASKSKFSSTIGKQHVRADIQRNVLSATVDS